MKKKLNYIGPIRDTLKDAGFVSIEKMDHGEYILTDADGKREVWAANKGHASYGIKYKNTHLEFVRDFLNKNT